MASLNERAREYLWVNEIEALTVAASSGRTAEDVVRIYGGDPAAPVGEYTFAEAGALGADPDRPVFHLQVAERGGHVVAFENDGYSGNLADVARRCSAGGGAFFSVYRNRTRSGPPGAIGEPVDPEYAWAVCFAMMEREGELGFERSWLREPVATYRIPEPTRLHGGH